LNKAGLLAQLLHAEAGQRRCRSINEGNWNMCGIIGIVGTEAAAPRLLESLRRLEYRGYDSAGVATLESGMLTRRRAEGKLAALDRRLAKEPLEGTTGIGHTRWATHGKPVERNAHPHMTSRVAIVHNGIIENFRELRDELERSGAVFESETDTEVVAHLLDRELRKGSDPEAAVKAPFRGFAGPSRWPSCSLGARTS
jgi:glucosamine--fructose-6-phosphate aminotransferase (isomerizing)